MLHLIYDLRKQYALNYFKQKNVDTIVYFNYSFKM